MKIITFKWMIIAVMLATCCSPILTSCGDDEPSNNNGNSSVSPGQNGNGSGTALNIGAEFSDGNIRYEVINSEKEVAAIGLVDKQVSSANIPSTVKHGGTIYKITRVGKEYDYFFYSDNVVYAQENKWGNINNVVIPETVTRISTYAFSSCSFLSEISIPNSVISIGGGAFSGTKWEKERSSQKIVYAGLVAYKINMRPEEIVVLTSVEIKDGTKGIADGLFDQFEFQKEIDVHYDYEKIVKWTVNLPNSIIHIGNYSFANNRYGLMSVSLPQSLRSIGEGAFRNCKLFESVTIPQSVTSIGEYAFKGCHGLREVHSKITSPFPIEPETFANYNNQNLYVILYVPRGTMQKYIDTAGWTGLNGFRTIVEE